MSLSALVLDATTFLIDFVFSVLNFTAWVVGDDLGVFSVVLSSTHSPHLEWSLPEPIQKRIKILFNLFAKYYLALRLVAQKTVSSHCILHF